MTSPHSISRLLPIFSLLVAALLATSLTNMAFAENEVAATAEEEFSAIDDCIHKGSNLHAGSYDKAIEKSPGLAPHFGSYSSVCLLGKCLVKSESNEKRETGIKMLKKYADLGGYGCMGTLIDLYVGYLSKGDQIMWTKPEDTLPFTESIKKYVMPNEIDNYANRLDNASQTYGYPNVHFGNGFYPGYMFRAILLTKKGHPSYNPAEAAKIYADVIQKPNKKAEYYDYSQAQIAAKALSKMFEDGNGIVRDPAAAKKFMEIHDRYDKQQRAYMDDKIAKQKENDQAEEDLQAALRRAEREDSNLLAALVGAVAPVIASGGNYVPPPSSYSSGPSGNASDTVNAALNAVITGMGGTSNSGGRTGTPSGGIDTGTPYDNSRYSGNNTNANNSSQRSGQNTGSKDDDDRAYWQSRRSPAADVNCIQRVKTSSGTHYKNVCNKRISVRGFCYPPKQVQKDYPGKGLYSPNDHSGLDHYNPGDVDAGAGLVSLENMCIKSGRRYMMLVCDASTKETHYSDGYPDSPDLRTYSCFK